MEGVPYAPATEEQVRAIFQKHLAGEIPTLQEQQQFKTALLLILGREYCRLGIVMQIHFGVIRDNSHRVFRALGPDAGIDSIGDQASIKELAASSVSFWAPGSKTASAPMMKRPPYHC